MASWPWMDDSWLTGLKCSCYSCGFCYVTIFKHCFSKIYCQSAESAIAIEHNYSAPSSDGAFSYTWKCCSSPYHSLPTDFIIRRISPVCKRTSHRRPRSEGAATHGRIQRMKYTLFVVANGIRQQQSGSLAPQVMSVLMLQTFAATKSSVTYFYSIGQHNVLKFRAIFECALANLFYACWNFYAFKFRTSFAISCLAS